MKPVQSKKKLVIGVCAAAVLIAVICLTAFSGGAEEALYARPAAAPVNAREKTYQAYLDRYAYDGALSADQVNVDVFAWQEDLYAQTENG